MGMSGKKSQGTPSRHSSLWGGDSQGLLFPMMSLEARPAWHPM